MEDVECVHLLFNLGTLVSAAIDMSDKIHSESDSADLLFFSLLDHSVNLLLAQSTLLVGNDSALGLAGSLVGGGDLHDTVASISKMISI